jgi:short-subunit dehydrogenase
VGLEAVQRVFEESEKVLSAHGGFLRVLINNDGQGQGGKKRLADLDVSVDERKDTDIFEQIVMVNCGYPVLLTRAFLRHLYSRRDWNGNGRILIVNVASCAALMPSTPFSSLYSASKAFNRSFSLSLASELAAKRLLHYDASLPIDCVAVSPGFVESSMTQMSKSFICCTAQEHAKATLQAIAVAVRGGFWSVATDLIPHWKHALMWSFVKGIDWMVPHEPFMIGTVMPLALKAIRRYRKLDIKD